MNDRCNGLAEDLTALAMGDLQGAARDQVLAHIEQCDACRKELEETRSLCALFSELPRPEASPSFHQGLVRALELEQEMDRLTVVDRMRITAGFVRYKVASSAKARFLLYAAAAQILVLIALALCYGLTVQKTAGLKEPLPVGSLEEAPVAPEKEEPLIIYEKNDDVVRVHEPPTFRLPHPSIPIEIPVAQLDRRIERENRLELSRYRMYARYSVQCRNRMRQSRGGDSRTDYSVERGLRWLRAHQVEDGSWNPGGLHGGDENAAVGITSLCVATFLSDGHSKVKGRYSETVGNGINFLLANQDGQGRFGWIASDPGVSLFNQSTAVLVLSENYILSNGLHEEALVRGIEGLIRMTDVPATEDAYSNTWAAMALQTAVMTGIEVEQLDQATTDVEGRVALLARKERGKARESLAYRPPICSASEEAVTALFREEDGVPLPDARRPGTFFALLDEPDYREPSFLFFIGTALCENRDLLWDEWNRRVKTLLVDAQDRDGIWLAGGDWPWIDGGDLYTTALHLLTLQVYYRFIKLEENCP